VVVEDSSGDPPDDPSILDEWTLLRRISYRWVVGDAVGRRVSSQAFQEIEDENGVVAMSVHVEERLAQDGLAADAVVEGLDGYGFVAFRVSLARGLGLKVVWAPLTNDGLRGNAHAHVFGKLRKVKGKLAVECVCRLWPSPPSGA